MRYFSNRSEGRRVPSCVAEQKGIDVVLTLLDPQGGVIVAADSANGAWGPESAL